MVQYEWDRYDHRHHGKIEYQREICVHEGIDKQTISTLGLPLPEKDENIQENQYYKIYEIFHQVLHCITSFHLLPYLNFDLSLFHLLNYIILSYLIQGPKSLNRYIKE